MSRRKALALAAYLAMQERSHSREALANLLWPESDQRGALTNLRSTLPALTSLVDLDWLQANRATVRVNQNMLWVDAAVFRQNLAESRRHSHDPGKVCDGCRALFEEAAALYQADFMEGFSLSDSANFDDWQMLQQEALRREFGGVLQQLAANYYARREMGTAVSWARRWLALDPLHEPAHQLLIELYAADNRRADALRQYEECVRILNEELATPPTEATVQLYEQIRDNRLPPSPQKHYSPEISHSSGNPSGKLPGILPPFPPLVIGRNRATDELKARLGVPDPASKQPVTVVQGWPGVGKSTMTAVLAHDSDLAAAYPDGILWTSLGASPNVMANLSVWAKALNFSETEIGTNVTNLSQQLAAVLRDKAMLLIVDDVWQSQHAAPFKIGGRESAILFTSRLNDVALALAPTPADMYRLAVLGEEASLALLERLTPKTVAQHPEQARELVRDLEGLPLAIQVAGGLLHNEVRLGWGIDALLADLRDGANLLEAQAPEDMTVIGWQTPPTIAALLKLSTDLLTEEMRERLAYLGLFVPKPATFDLAAMAAAWDVADPRPAARILVDRGLLEPAGNGRFQMHALLVSHARTLLDEFETAEFKPA